MRERAQQLPDLHVEMGKRRYTAAKLASKVRVKKVRGTKVRQAQAKVDRMKRVNHNRGYDGEGDLSMADAMRKMTDAVAVEDDEDSDNYC